MQILEKVKYIENIRELAEKELNNCINSVEDHTLKQYTTRQWNPELKRWDYFITVEYYRESLESNEIIDSSKGHRESETNHSEKPKNDLRWGYAFFKEDGTFEITQIIEDQKIKLKVHPHVDELKKSKDNYIWVERGVIFLKNGFKKRNDDPDYNIMILKKTS